jgi:hypothetical protein
VTSPIVFTAVAASGKRGATEPAANVSRRLPVRPAGTMIPAFI